MPVPDLEARIVAALMEPSCVAQGRSGLAAAC